MHKINFNDLNMEDKIKYFNSNLEKGETVKEICKVNKLNKKQVLSDFENNNIIYNNFLNQFENIENLFPSDEANLKKFIREIVTEAFESSNNKSLKHNFDGLVINRSYRIYDNIASKFNNFCKSQQLNQYEILSIFIAEGIQKYS